jgi:hypothetical protein
MIHPGPEQQRSRDERITNEENNAFQFPLQGTFPSESQLSPGENLSVT